MTVLTPRPARRARNFLLGSTALVAAAAAAAPAYGQTTSPAGGGTITGAQPNYVWDDTAAGGGIDVLYSTDPVTLTGVTISNTTAAGAADGKINAGTAYYQSGGAAYDTNAIFHGTTNISSTQSYGIMVYNQSRGVSVTNDGDMTVAGTWGGLYLAGTTASVTNTGTLHIASSRTDIMPGALFVQASEANLQLGQVYITAVGNGMSLLRNANTTTPFSVVTTGGSVVSDKGIIVSGATSSGQVALDLANTTLSHAGNGITATSGGTISITTRTGATIDTDGASGTATAVSAIAGNNRLVTIQLGGAIGSAATGASFARGIYAQTGGIANISTSAGITANLGIYAAVGAAGGSTVDVGGSIEAQQQAVLATGTAAISVGSGVALRGNQGFGGGATVQMEGGSLDVRGTVSNGLVGVPGNGPAILAGGSAGSYTITNHAGGRIEGGAAAIRLQSSGTHSVVLEQDSTTIGNITAIGDGANTVSIAGALQGSFDASTTNSIDTLTLEASGSMIGASLGAGDDSFTYKGGTVTGTIDGGAGTDTLTLAGNGTLNVTGFENLVQQAGNTTLTGSLAGVSAITAGNGTPSGTLTFDSTGLTANITVNGATIRALSAGAFGTGTITMIDPTIQYGATGTYANQIILAATDPVNDPTRLEADAGVVATLTGQLLEQGTGQPLVIGGAGTIVLTNSNNFWSGGTRILAGATLQGSGSALGNGYNPIANDGTIVFDGSGNFTQYSAITGSGALVKRGSGALVLTDPNGYTGTTTIEAGTLQINHFSALNSSSAISLTGATAVLDNNSSDGAVLNNLSGVAGSQVLLRGKSATLANSANTVFAGTLSGNSSIGISKTGAGTLTLSGNNTGLSAPLLINAGTVALAGSGSLVAAGYIAVNGGTFDISGVTASGTSIRDLRGTGGSVVLGSKLLTITSAANGSSFAGVISGSGGVTLSGGVATLAGANTYTGATTVALNAQLNLSGAGSLASSDLTLNGFLNLIDSNSTIRSIAGGSFMSSAFLNGRTLTITNGGSYAGQFNSGALNLTGGTLTLTGSSSVDTIALNGGNLTVGDGGTGGNIYTSYVLTDGTLTINKSDDTNVANINGGAGNLVQAGSNLLSLWNNSYTGTTTVNSGTVRLLYGNALADTAVLVVNTGGSAELFGSAETIGSLSGAGNFNLNGNALTLTDGGNFSGVISGTGISSTVTLSGGTLTLAGANTYDGGTIINSGAGLTLGNGGTTGSVAGAITANGTLTVNRSDSYVLGGFIGNGTFVQAGSGTTHLSGAADFLGNVTVAAGTLALDNATVLSNVSEVALTGADAALDLTASGGIVHTLSGIAGTTVRYGDAGMRLVQGSAATFAGSFDDVSTGSPAPALRLFGTGTLTLTGQSNMRAVSIEGGTLALGGTGSLGAATSVSMIGGMLDLSGVTGGSYTLGDITGFAGTVTLGANTLVVNLAGTSAGFGGAIQGSGGVQLASGSWSLELGQAYTGTTTVDAGASLSLTGSGSFASGNVAVAGTLRLADATDTITLNALSGTGDVLLGSKDLILGQGGFAGAISGGSGGVTIASGTQLLTQNWSYGGATTLLASTNLTIGNGGANGALVGAVVLNGGTLTTNRSGTVSINGLSGTGTFEVAGSGETRLYGNGAFTGNAIVSNGALTLGDAEALEGSASLNLAGANTALNTGNDLELAAVNNLTGVAGSTVNIGRNVLLINSTVATTFNGTLYSIPDPNPFFAQGMVKSGAETLTLTGQNTLVSAFIEDGTLALSGAGALGDSAYVLMRGGTLDLSRITSGASAIGSLNSDGAVGTVELGATTLTINGSDLSREFGGVIQGSGGLHLAGNSVTLLTGTNSYSGATVIDAGATLALLTSSTVPDSIGIPMSDASIVNSAVTANGVFDLRGTFGQVATAGLSGSGTVFLGDDWFRAGSNNADTSFSGTLTGGNGLFWKDGTGTLTLSGASDLSQLTVFDGTLALTGDASLGTNAEVGVVFGTFDISGINADSLAIADLSDFGSVQLGAKTLEITNGYQSYSGTIEGTGGVHISGGYGTFGGEQLYTGLTTIDAGATLYLVGFDGALTGAAQVDGTLDIDLHAGDTHIGGLSGSGSVLLGANSLTVNGGGSFSGIVSGDGGLTFAAGTSTLGGANTYAGTTTIDSGATLALAGTGTTGAGAVIANGALDISGTTGGATIANLSGAGIVALGANTLTLGTDDQDSDFAGVIGGTGGLTKTGTGVLTLSGANTYTGLTQVADGTLRLGASGVLADDSTLEVLNGATLDMNGFDETVAAFTIQGNLIGSGTLTAALYNFLGGTIDHDLGGGAIHQISGTTLLNGSSDGSAVHVEGGTLMLGANERLADTAAVTVLTGATLDLQGYGETVGSLALAGTLGGTGTLAAGTYTLDSATVDANLGAGTLIQHSGLSYLNGTAATETVNITGGTLQLGDNDRLADTAAVTVAAGTALDLQGFNDTVGSLALAGTLSGTGKLTATTYTLDSAVVDANLGTGTLIQHSGTSLLNGTTATDTVNVAGGTLQLGGNDRLADTAALTIASGTALDLQGFSDTVGTLALAGTLSGTGTLTAATYTLDSATVNANLGAGTLIQHSGTSLLNGTAATATVNVDAGTLRLGASDRLADAAVVTVASGTTLDLQGFNDSVGSLALAGTLSGTGTLSATTYILDSATVNANLGAGTLIQHSGTSLLNGTTATATVNIDAGTLRLGASDLLADTAAVIVTAGTTLDLQGFNDSVGTLALAGTLSGTGTLTAATYTLNGATVDANLGAGTLVQNSGTSVLHGSFAGSAAQINGGTLAFDRANTTTYAGSLSGTGTLAQISTGLLTLSGNSAAFAGTTTVSGGGLAVTGQLGGNVEVASTLSGTGSIGGTVSIADGAHLVGATGSTLSMGALSLASGAVIDATLSQPSSTALFAVTGDLTLDGTLNVTAQPNFGAGVYRLISYGGTLTDNGLTLGTVTGATTAGLSVQTGAVGQVNLVNTSGVTLSFWDGGTAANHDNGIVNGGTGTWSATARNWTDANGNVNGAMQPVPSFAVFQGTGGTVTIDNGAGQVSATGLQFASNGYTLAGGALALSGSQATIRVGDGTAAGAGMTATIASALTGDSALVKTDLGTLVLTGANSYTGGTIVQAGALIGNASSIQGNVQNAGTVTFDQAGNASFAGTTSGTGSYVKSGAGALTLTGASSANWQVTAGSLASTTALFTGNANLAQGTSLVFNQATSGNYAGTLTGTGSLVFQGGGTVLLTGNSAGFAGTTSVGAGSMFSVNGTLGGTINVLAGGRLQGSGTAGSASIAGTIAPGNSIGTLTFTGNLAFTSSSVFEVEANAAGQSDKIVVNGSASIASGAAVSVLAENGNYAANTSYTILSAAGGLSGTFSNVTTNLAFLTPTLAYSANAVTLNLARNTVDFSTVTQTGNQGAVAPRVQALGVGNAVYDAVVALSASEARAAFDQLAGSDYASMRASLIEDSRFIRDAMLSRDEMAGVEGLAMWGRVTGSWRTVDGNAEAQGYKRSTQGFVTGFDGSFDSHWRMGVALNYGTSEFRTSNATHKAESYQAGASLLGSYGPVSIQLGTAYGWHSIDSQRHVAFGSLNQLLGDKYDARTFQTFGQLAVKGRIGGVDLRPFVGLAHVALFDAGVNEHGGAAALHGGGTDGFAATYGSIGLKGRIAWDLGGTKLSLDGSAAARRVFGDRVPTIDLAFAGGSAFQASGIPLDRTSAAVDLGLALDLSEHIRLGVSYTGTYADRSTDHGARAQLNWRF